MIKTYWLFESTYEEKEYHPATYDEVTYKAWGCVMCVQWPYDRPDGEVVGVLYRTPSGRLVRTWKQMQEIELSDTTQKEWRGIHDLILWDDADPGSTAQPNSQAVH